MNLNDNIRRLRQKKGLTQEQLAELMNVSGAAVSKWESGSSCPDIALLIPLASVFDVTMDQLMGYDAAKIRLEVEKARKEYETLSVNGKAKEARDLLKEARKSWPNDYTIMYLYVKDLSRDNGMANEQCEELLGLCDCILDGRTDEYIRLETISRKAGLLYAMGDIVRAEGLLESMPQWACSRGLAMEALFERGTPEKLYWTRRNIYELGDGVAVRLVTAILGAPDLSPEEKYAKGEALGDLLTDIRAGDGYRGAAVAEHTVFAKLANTLTALDGKTEDIIRLRRKQLAAAGEVTRAAKADRALSDALERTYGTADLLKWDIEWLKTARYKKRKDLAGDPAYRKMLREFQ